MMNISDPRAEDYLQGDSLAIELHTQLRAIPATPQIHALQQALRDEGRAALHSDTPVMPASATKRVIPIIAVK
ncbi:hypothetical protein [Polaromonas sp.]|uniref:hypothetical protein n=1 Tax=Polaromonas sp. TaxID=1869339 RepID=UPI0032641C83